MAKPARPVGCCMSAAARQELAEAVKRDIGVVADIVKRAKIAPE